MTVKIKYHYIREVNRDSSVKECTFSLVDWDFEFIQNMVENLDDAGYRVISVSIVDEAVMDKARKEMREAIMDAIKE